MNIPNKVIIFFLLFVLLVVFGIFVLLNKEINPLNSPKSATTGTKLSKDWTEYEKKIAYVKKMNLEASKNIKNTNAYEVWVMDIDGTNKEKLNLPPVNRAVKYPGTKTVIYTLSTEVELAEGKSVNLYIYDLETKQTTSIPIKPDIDTDLQMGASFDSMRYVSPMHDAVILNVTYLVDCETDRKTIEMGMGACGPDDPVNYPMGGLVFNLNTRQLYPLGDDFLYPTLWDTKKQELYYHSSQASALYKMNYATGIRAEVVKGKSFGYVEYPFLDSTKSARVEGETGSTGISKSTIGIYDSKSQAYEEFDSGRWADIQPFVSISPNLSTLIYERTDNDGDGKVFNALWKYDLKTKQKSILSPTNMRLSYRAIGHWVDNENLITSVLLNNYSESRSYRIVKINTVTGLETILTADDVAEAL